MKHLFIINPIAGKGRTLDYVPQIKKLFDEIKEEYFIEITEGPGHATEIARDYVKNGIYRVYSVGGDGTLNEVLNGIVGSLSSLAVIPGGSGNDFFRSICEIKKPGNLLSGTVNGSERLIDIANVNGRYFLNISSVGFDAEAALHQRLVKKIPFISGSLAYFIGILITIIKNKKYDVLVSIDDSEAYTGKIMLSAVANGRFYGGGILPAPEAKLDDGLLDICFVKKVGRLKILFLLPLYMKGKHTKIKEVNILKARKIKLFCEKEIPLNIDGEVTLVKQALFEIIPKGIKVVVPDLTAAINETDNLIAAN